MISRRSFPLIGAMLAALAAIAVAAFLFWHQIIGNGGPDAAATGEVVVAPGVTMGGPFALTEHTGRAVTDAAYAGKFMLIYFGFTFCPDICPTELNAMAVAVDLLGEEDAAMAEAVTPIFITVDPARDTVEVVAEYVSAFHPRMVGLTGSESDIAELAREYRVYFSKNPPDEDGDYLVDHTSYVYLMGPDGGFVTLFKGGTAPENLANGIRRYVGSAG